MQRRSGQGEATLAERGEAEGGAASAGARWQLGGSRLRAARALCEGEDSEQARRALRTLAEEAGFGRDEVAGMDRDQLCRLLGIEPTGLRGASAFPPDMRLMGAAAAMRNIVEFAAGGRGRVVRDGPDPATQIQVLDFQLPAGVESQGGFGRAMRRAMITPVTLNLPPLPEGFQPARIPARYFSQGASGFVVAPLVLRVLVSRAEAVAAACLAEDGGLLPRYLALYDPQRDPEIRSGPGDGVACVMAGLVGSRGASGQRAVLSATRVCVVAYDRGDRSLYAVATTLPDGTQHLAHGLGFSPKVAFAADPADPRRARIVVSSLVEVPGSRDVRLSVSSFLIEPGAPPKPDHGYSGEMPLPGEAAHGHSLYDVALVPRPLHESEVPVLRVTGGRGVRDYFPPDEEEDDLDTSQAGREAAWRGEAFTLATSGRRPGMQARWPEAKHRSSLEQDMNPLAGDLFALLPRNNPSGRMAIASGPSAMAEVL
jgi:hypothetical protein